MSNVMKIWKLLAGIAVMLGLAGSAWAGSGMATHEHAGHQVKPVLNDGNKWATDEPLRKGMARIRSDMEAALHDIHEGKLKAAGYKALAEKVAAQISGIVAECKLDPKADAQLHIVIAQMLEGVEAMHGKQKKIKRQAGAVTVFMALEQYGAYFDDPDSQTHKH